MDTEYGTIVSTKETELLLDSDLPKADPEEDSEISPLGNALWSYKEEHRINGIQVAPGDCGLPIDRDDVLNTAFQLMSVPKSLLLWLSPDDAEAIAKYDALLQQVYDGSVIIQDEIKQYDQTKGKFMVWIRYNEVSYKLHPRFQFLREEVK